MYLQVWYSSTPASGYPATGETVRVHVDTTMTPIPYNLASSWPGMDNIRNSADYGSYDTRMVALLSGSALPTTITHVVHFKNAFPAPPTVMVWLTGLSAARHATVCVKVTANNVTESEFALQISSAGSAGLSSVGVAWAVWPITPHWGQTTAKVGSVSTVAAAAARVRNLNATGIVPVGPVIFVALSSVDLVLGERLWMDVEMVKNDGGYGPRGSTWSLSAGPVGASVYSARLAYASR